MYQLDTVPSSGTTWCTASRDSWTPESSVGVMGYGIALGGEGERYGNGSDGEEPEPQEQEDLLVEHTEIEGDGSGGFEG